MNFFKAVLKGETLQSRSFFLARQICVTATKKFCTESEKQMAKSLTTRNHGCFSAVLGAILWAAMIVAPPRSAWPQNVKTHEETTQILVVEKITINEGTVSGEIFNRSSRLVRDVQLFIRYTWLWDNETKPGTADPGTSSYYTLQKEIPAGGRLPFTFTPSSPLPNVSRGRFATTVSIASYTEVIPQTK